MPSLRILSKRTHQPGNINTPVFNVPVGLRKFVVSALMDAIDLADTSLTMDWQILAKFSGETDFKPLYGGRFVGGLDPEGEPQQAPGMSWTSTGLLPTELKGEFILNKRISIGFDVDVT